MTTALRVFLLVLTMAALAGLAPASATYDANGRLLTSSGPWGNNGTQSTNGAYVYDALGNLRSRTEGSRSSVVSYDAATNRVSQVVRNGSTTLPFAYDARGNVTANGFETFVYDHANQAVSIGSGSSYVYDGNLKRVKQVDVWPTYTTTAYSIYSRVTGGIIYRDETSNQTGATVTKLTDYVAAGSASLRLEKKGSTTTPTYAHGDHQGSTTTVTNGSGAIAFRLSNLPYGMQLKFPAANANLPTYTGHVTDTTTDLIYMQARHYDPFIGRFYSTDPIGYQDQLNLYAYVANDPVNKTDPTGECSETFAGSSTLCNIEDALTKVLTPVVEGAMELVGVDVVPEGERDPGGTTSHTAPEQSAGAEAAAITAVAAGVLVDRVTGGKRGGGHDLIPDKAVKTLASVRQTGKAPDGHVGGRSFENREGRLPTDGNYKEYDVDVKPTEGPRNAERIVVDDDTGRAFYTPDHYQTFQEIEY